MTSYICEARIAKREVGIVMADASGYRVSTITWNGSVGCPINYDLFFEHVALVPPEAPAESEGIVWADLQGRNTRGVYPKRRKRTVGGAAKTPKTFDNQVTTIFKLAAGYFPNVKLFLNGNVHITGVRCEEEAIRINDTLVEEIRRIYADGHTDILRPLADDKPGDINLVKSCNFRIRMINSDFKVPFRIRRKDLHKLLISDAYGNKSVFQPGSYPGVKLQYFWNKENAAKDGVCRCHGNCLGKKGDGAGEGDCKKVTIAIFESGSILITGANALVQIDDAYRYISRILQQQRDQVEKVLPPTVSST